MSRAGALTWPLAPRVRDGRTKLSSIPPPISASAPEPIRYAGQDKPEKRFYDGGLRHAVGVHLYQALRANRSHAPEGGKTGWTYNHQPYIAYWNGRFYLQYLSNFKDEHGAPGRTLFMTSKDGRSWDTPQVVFPEYPLPEIEYEGIHIPAETPAVMHQRMGFYVTPENRMLTLGFYSFCPTPRHSPNQGQGLGRVVREIYSNGKLGPIYFIRYNRHAGWNETNTSYPFYRSSTDAGFVKACDTLLQDKLMTLQWWEEDRATDGFYTIQLDGMQPKALSFCHRPDGVVLGVWKAQLAALSPDEGRTWTHLVKCPTILECNAKTWIQRTDDGRYALVYNHSATRRNRFPLVVMTSKDCHVFDHMSVVHGELPPMRYQGIHKNLGPQYVRGIAEGNGNAPGNHLWITYSMNKEDIWVSRMRVPLASTVDHPVNEDFETAVSTHDLEFWNLYSPQWAPISVVCEPGDAANRCLELRDQEPFDYARAERIFPESRCTTVTFRILAHQVGPARLDFEIQDRQGRRPMRLQVDSTWLSTDLGTQSGDPIRIISGQWLSVNVYLDCGTQQYDLAVNGTLRRGIRFAEKVDSLERLVFRTGPYRGDVRPTILDGQPRTLGLDEEDLPGADVRIPASIYLIDDVRSQADLQHYQTPQ